MKIVNKFETFQTTVEIEKRCVITSEQFSKAIDSKQITLLNHYVIQQKWLSEDENSTTRIRKTIYSNDKITYEHTVKYKKNKDVVYEITTNIKEFDFDVIDKIYKDTKKFSKMRFVINDNSGKYRNYIITADFYLNKESDDDKIRIEFEKIDPSIKDNFEFPEWCNEN